MEGFPPYPPALVRKYQRHRWWLGTTIIDALERTCDLYPDKLAVVEGPHRLTFSQLREGSHQAAKAFQRLGLSPGDLVLLQVPNWAEVSYIYLGLQRLGVIPVMCLPRHGFVELEKFCSLTSAKAWIGAGRFGKFDYVPMIRALQQKLPSLELAIVVRGEAAGMLPFAQIMEETPPAKARSPYWGGAHPSPMDTLHLGPTGGTTGLPKLVPKTHNNHLTKSYFLARFLELGTREVSLVFSPISHDAPHLLNFCNTILFGTTTVLSPSTQTEDILENIERERVTYCFLPPALLVDVLQYPDLEKRDLASLHTIIVGGAHSPVELVRLALRRLKCRLHNGYGMTEGASIYTKADDPPEVIANTVGKGICPYDEYRIVDEEGRELPQGEEGELAMRGPCIFSGYYKSEEENRLVFTPQGLFRSGDLAKFDPWGNFIITGRKKDIINRGGEKISAHDVEEMLLTYPKILRAAAFGMPDPRLGERICAYVQPKPQELLTSQEVLAYLKEKGASLLLLPERIEVVPELPLTTADKIDKQRLREDIIQKLQAEEKLP